MAIIDSLTEFCDAVSVAKTSGASYLLGNQIDLQTARNYGGGQPLYLIITVDTAIVTGGAAGTISFSLCSDASAAVAVDGSQTTHLTTQLFVTDDTPTIPAGSVLFCGAIPDGLYGDNDYERYVGLICTVATTTTAGKINAWLSPDPIGGWLTPMPKAVD